MTGDFSTSSLNIIDEDLAPYNYFNCIIEDNQNFIVINDNLRKTVNQLFSL